MNNTSALSYTKIIDDIKKFKSSIKKSDSIRDFGALDMPSQKYFKILFYFGSESEFDNSCSGLLDPTWTKFTSSSNYYDFNTAWAYLKLNDENERADKLEKFITLLSDISSKSPWYFSSVNGLAEAMERKVAEDGKLELQNKKITITCLPDSFDNRIGTLLELYREITWSWIHKREIIPSNLRKFDMAIYMFESPTNNWNIESTIDSTSDDFKVSYKMLEFHDCEISYNSIKSGINEISNQTGFSPTYTIEINYNDCYEISYNDFIMRKIGDVILTDLVNYSFNPNSYESILSSHYPYKNIPSNNDESMLEAHLGITDKGFFSKSLEQIYGHLKADVKSLFNKAVMGNIYGLSLTKVANQLSELQKGDIVRTGMTVAQYMKSMENNAKGNNESTKGSIFEPVKSNNESPNGRIFEETGSESSESPKGSIFEPVIINKAKSTLGNIFKNSTIANN